MAVDWLLKEIFNIIFTVSNFRLDYRKIFEYLSRFFINTLNEKYNANGFFCKDSWKNWFVEAKRDKDSLLKLETLEGDGVSLPLLSLSFLGVTGVLSLWDLTMGCQRSICNYGFWDYFSPYWNKSVISRTLIFNKTLTVFPHLKSYASPMIVSRFLFYSFFSFPLQWHPNNGDDT